MFIQMQEYRQNYKDIQERELERQRMTFVVPGQGMYDPPGFFNPYTPFNPPGMYGMWSKCNCTPTKHSLLRVRATP